MSLVRFAYKTAQGAVNIFGLEMRTGVKRLISRILLNLSQYNFLNFFCTILFYGKNKAELIFTDSLVLIDVHVKLLSLLNALLSIFKICPMILILQRPGAQSREYG